MNWTIPPVTENPTGSGEPAGDRPLTPTPPASTSNAPHIVVAKKLILNRPGDPSSSLEVFTLALGDESIELLPMRTWNQLDVHKWAARGRLPGQPGGFDSGFGRVSLSGESVSTSDPDGCSRLEKLLNQWLQQTLEAQALAHSGREPSWARAPAPSAAAQPQRFRVEVDKLGQVHVHVLKGKDILASVGLSQAGLTSLNQQGLMRKPRALSIGVLHDWIELDGTVCSFEHGKNDAASLEQILNERYLPVATTHPEKAVLVMQNAASPTGFDIEFPLITAGVPHHPRRHLDQEAIEALQDPHHCGLLHPGLIIKLLPPNLVFKRRLADGGEQYLSPNRQNTVRLTDEDGSEKQISLSQPLNLMRLTAAELTSVFNHPAINRHASELPSAPSSLPATVPPAPAPVEKPIAAPEQAPPLPDTAAILGSLPPEPPAPNEPPSALPAQANAPQEQDPPVPAEPRPNIWLEPVLVMAPVRPDWQTCVLYKKLVELFGNSAEGRFGPSACWYIQLGREEDLDHPNFKGIFLTEKGGLGFLSGNFIVRFCHGVVFVGSRNKPLEGIHVALLGVGLDAREHLVFLVTDDYRERFGEPENLLADVLEQLSAAGAAMMSAAEALSSTEPLEVVWTVPAEQSNPDQPEALESRPPTPPMQ